MSSRFDNLIKLVVDRFEIDDYNLLSEALSLTQIQDQLKEKNIDISQYNPKHYLFLLALLNSNLNLDVYNQITTSIKDQGILNRLIAQTVDKRSNEPTVDPDIINRVLHNTTNIPELNAILNSIGQSREKPAATEEDKAKGIEDLATRTKKEVTKALVDKFGAEMSNSILSTSIFHLIDLAKEKYPNDRLVSNYSYALPLASYWLNLPDGADDNQINKLGRLLNQLFPKYLADEDIRQKKVIFNEPYRSNFYKFSNYLYQYFREKRFKEEGKDGDLMNAYVFKNEDVTVYAGTVEDTHGSIRRCIKYGKGVNPKYGFCISGSTAASNYTYYRFNTRERKHLTTYFVYFNKPEDIQKYNSELFIFEPFYDSDDKLTYQYNPGAGNPGETRITPEDAITKYPMLKEPLEKGVFKIVNADESEKEKYRKISNAVLNHIESVDDLIDWIEMTDPTLTSSSFEKIFDKFPEGGEYALDYYIKRTIDFAEDNVDNNYFMNSGNSLEFYVFDDIKDFLNKHPELKEKYDKLKPSLKQKELRMVMNSGGVVSSEYFLKLYNEYPNLVEKSLDEYIIARENSWNAVNGDLYRYVFGTLNHFFDKHPEYGNKYKGKISEFQIKEMEKIITDGPVVKSGYFQEFAKNHPDLVDDALDRYIKRRFELYFTAGKSSNTIKDYVFNNAAGFINSNPKYIEKYRITPELKQKEMENLIKGSTPLSSVYLNEVKQDYPDLLTPFLDEYAKHTAEFLLAKPQISSDVFSAVDRLYYGIVAFIDNNPEFKDRYLNYEKELILHHFKSNPKSHLAIEQLDFEKIFRKYPDILGQCLEIYLNNKIKLLQDISYNALDDRYYDSSGESYDYNDAHYLYIAPDISSEIHNFFADNTEAVGIYKDVASPLLNKIEEICAINKIILTNRILDSEELSDLQKKFSEEVFNSVLDRYLKERIDGFKNSLKRGNVNNMLPKGDLEANLFDPLKKFLYYNPKIAEKYKEARKELKLLAFEICGEEEDKYVSYDNKHDINENDMYLTSGWLQDVKNRFPDILQKGLDIYISQKLETLPLRNIKEYRSDRDKYELINIESEVFKRIHEFEKENKSLFEKYTDLRMAAISKFLGKMEFKQLLDSAFFFRLEDTFRPTFYRVVFKKYIKDKIDFIEDVKNNSHTDSGYDPYEDEDTFYNVSNKDLYGYVFDPLEEFIQTHPDLNEENEQRTHDLKYSFLVNYLTKNYTSSQDLKNKAIKYLRFLNNNNEDNTEIYQRIINELRYAYTSRKSTSHQTINAYKSFYENIDDKDVLKKIFSIGSNKDHLLGTIASNDSGYLFNNGVSNIVYFHELINFKIKSSKLKNANPKSFYRMINEISPNAGDTILETLFKVLENKSLKIGLIQLLDVFFSDKKIYDYINENKSFKNELFNSINNADIINTGFDAIRIQHKSRSLKLYLDFIQQFPNYEENKVYKLTIDYDQRQIERYKKLGETNNGLLDPSNLDINFFKTPPDLSNFTIKSVYSGEVVIKVISLYPIKTLKFLPSSIQRNSGKLYLTDCVLENNIDKLPSGITELELDGTTVSPNKDLISKHTNTDSLKFVSLRSVKNLKTLSLNIKKLITLKIFKCEDLISLKGSPEEIHGGFTISSCSNLKSLKGAPFKAIQSTITYMHGLTNFLGIPRSHKYVLNYNTINSFKGLPNVIDVLEMVDDTSNKHLVRKSYSYFPDSIDTLIIPTNNNGSKSKFWRYLFSRIKNVFPSYIGNIDTYITLYVDNLTHPYHGTDPFEKEIHKIYNKKRTDSLTKKDREKETVERIKQERTPTIQDELEDIESKQDKVANKQKIKRLRKEDVEVVAPFNVLLEDILNTIKTSFKVYK